MKGGDSSGISDRGTKAKLVRSCDNAYRDQPPAGLRLRRSDIRIKAKNATSCGNAFMTDVMSARGGLASIAVNLRFVKILFESIRYKTKKFQFD